MLNFVLSIAQKYAICIRKILDFGITKSFVRLACNVKYEILQQKVQTIGRCGRAKPEDKITFFRVGQLQINYKLIYRLES